MSHHIHDIRLRSVLHNLWPILQHHMVLRLWVSLDDLDDIVAKPSTDINEQFGVFVRPAIQYSFGEGIYFQELGSAISEGAHELAEVLGHVVLRQQLEEVVFRGVAILRRRVVGVGWVLVVDRFEIGWDGVPGWGGKFESTEGTMLALRLS